MVKQMNVRMPTSVEGKKRLAAAARPNVSSAAPKMLTVPEVCEYLRVSRSTLYRLFRERNIPAFRFSKRDWRVVVDDLAQWIERESRAGRFTGKV
jgi:excisionase family DNA binding protein